MKAAGHDREWRRVPRYRWLAALFPGGLFRSPVPGWRVFASTGRESPRGGRSCRAAVAEPCAGWCLLALARRQPGRCRRRPVSACGLRAGTGAGGCARGCLACPSGGAACSGRWPGGSRGCGAGGGPGCLPRWPAAVPGRCSAGRLSWAARGVRRPGGRLAGPGTMIICRRDGGLPPVAAGAALRAGCARREAARQVRSKGFDPGRGPRGFRGSCPCAGAGRRWSRRARGAG